MPPQNTAKAADYIKKYEQLVARKLDALTRAVERELRVRAIWDPFEQDWYFEKAGGKRFKPRLEGLRRRDVRPG